MYDVYFEEGFVVLECLECGELTALTYDEFELLVDSGEFELIEYDDEDEFEYCDCEDYEGCYDYYDEDDFDEETVEEELDEELIELLEEMRFCREEGDYEGYVTLAKAYTMLFELIYE